MDSRHLEIIGKLVVLAGSVFTVYKLFIEVIMKRKTQLRDEYRFVKKFILDISSPTTHSYLIEKGFAAISGKENLNASEIRYLLSQSNPSFYIKTYGEAKKYIEYSEKNGQIKFKEKYVKNKKRKRIKLFYKAGYFISAIFALTPLIFATNIFTNWKLALLFISMSILAFAPQAIMCLIEVRRIEKGEKLVKMQENNDDNSN